MAGIYIMFNDGKLSAMNEASLSSVFVAKGIKYTKYWFLSQIGNILITTLNAKP
jgi:hypothetical protein